MNQLLKDVVTFHTTYGHPVIESPAVPPKVRQKLRVKLIREELKELQDAFKANDIVAVADALTDLLYVVNGAVIECGLKDYIDKCHAEVQASNMSKLGADGKPIIREDGKILKGPNFVEPDLASIVNKPKVTTFGELELREEFNYLGKRLMKISGAFAATQEPLQKYRTIWLFAPEDPVERI